uniref:Caspase-like protease n=1 Tax=Suberites domuncula TaxID=55567 RepID=A7M858_SUBDO|nr:caspase-like protease [Suberites domuncula]
MAEQLCLQQVLAQNAKGYGLAIIITNDYRRAPDLSALTETHNDGKRIADVFRELNYAVFHMYNVSEHQLDQLLYEATQKSTYPRCYQSIVVVYSGHGSIQVINDQNSLTFLYTQDCFQYPIKEIVKCFMPSYSPKIGAMPKVFLIDACLGDKQMYTEAVTVPKSGGAEVRGLAMVSDKGGKEVPTIDVPPEGNYIVAHSTSVGYQSYEIKGSGGVWIKRLAEKIRFKGRDESVMNILTEVSGELLQLYQNPSYRMAMAQPYALCKLHGTLYFVPQQAGIVRQRSKEMKGIDHKPVQIKGKGFYKAELNTMEQKGQISSFKFGEDVKTKSGEFLASVSFQKTLTGKTFVIPSSAPKPTIKEAREEAARVAFKRLESEEKKPPAEKRSPSKQSPSIRRQTSTGEKTELQRLKEGCESKKYKHDLYELSTGQQQSFRFQVTVKNESGKILVKLEGDEEGAKKAAQHNAARKANVELGFYN